MLRCCVDVLHSILMRKWVVPRGTPDERGSVRFVWLHLSTSHFDVAAEYAFQLAIHNVGSARAELAAVEQERAQLADALVAAERRVDTVEGALEKRDKRVTFLMEQNHALELKMENEARAQKLALRKLELELNKKAQLVAQLTTQLHAMSRLRHQQQHVPSPPSAGTPTGRIPSRHGKLLRCGSAISLASSAALDGDVDSKMTSASAEFLVSAAASGSSGSLHASLGPQHAVLPPISVTSAAARPCMPAKHTSGVAASDSPPSANN